ncbi:MAG: thiamine diphosphokinase [Selenomonadaceae bacterium]|nr:thiamine diphosphokinase [Selenomonadaceae bacterium]
MDRLILPQLAYSSSKLKDLSEVILVSGGREPNADWFNKVKVNRPIYCVDHGIDFCKKIDIIPELLIGDLDSAASDSVQWALDNSIKIEPYPIDKDFTDLQLALNHIDDKTFAIITGTFGGRLDHLFSTLLTCANTQLKICLADDHEIVLFVSSGESISIEINTKTLALSLLQMTELCRGVTIDGVHWTLQSADLKQSVPSAISNRVESNTVNLSIKEGKLAVYLCFDE